MCVDVWVGGDGVRKIPRVLWVRGLGGLGIEFTLRSEAHDT